MNKRNVPDTVCCINPKCKMFMKNGMHMNRRGRSKYGAQKYSCKECEKVYYSQMDIRRHKTKCISQHGYSRVRITKKRHQYEHDYKAEKALGKNLPKGSMVHHVDLNKANNTNNNLVICQDAEYHFLLHARTKAVLCGKSPTEIQCPKCLKWKTEKDFYHRKKGAIGKRISTCKSCLIFMAQKRQETRREEGIECATCIIFFPSRNPSVLVNGKECNWCKLKSVSGGGY